MKEERIVIYDFDGTLFNSPDRETGEIAYLEATGMTFPFSGWWGRIESLSPPVVPKEPSKEWFIEKTLNAYYEDAKDPNSCLILMTGRPFKNRKRVIEILDYHDIKFHKHYFRGQPGQRGRDTFEIKCNFIKDDLIHPNLKVLEIWEDRPEHTSGFIDFAKRLKSKHNLNKIVVHDILSEKHHHF